MGRRLLGAGRGDGPTVVSIVPGSVDVSQQAYHVIRFSDLVDLWGN